MPEPTAVEILTLEATWPRHTGEKESAIAAAFSGMTPSRYYQLLSRAIDDPAGIAHDPQLTARIRTDRAHRLDFIARTRPRTF